MLEGLDNAPLIDCGRFTPDMIAAPEAQAATLDAALRETTRAGRAEATMLDLWLHRPGGANLSMLERPGLGAGTSWHALAALGGDGGMLDLGGGKDVPLFAAYGDKDDELEGGVVKGPNSVDEGDTGNMGGPGGGFYPGGPSGPEVGNGGEVLQPTDGPNCSNSNAITGKEAPDGAKYLVPEDVTAADLQSAIDHIVDVAREGGKPAALRAIYSMYEIASDPYFIDFKDWGTSNGPTGSQGAGTVTYFSTSLGQQITANAFEAFGNYFFGVICTLAGLAPEETRAIAALTQSGRLNEIADGDIGAVIEAMIYGDDPQDRPFVTDGIADATAFWANPDSNGQRIGVREGNCGS